MKRSMIKKSTAFVLATLLLLINIAVFLLPDVALSDRAQIKVSAKSREFLSGLDSDVEISVIRGSTHDTVFESFMKEYASCSDKITLRFLELSEASEMLSDVGYSASGENASYAVIVKSDKRAKLLD